MKFNLLILLGGLAVIASIGWYINHLQHKIELNLYAQEQLKEDNLTIQASLVQKERLYAEAKKATELELKADKALLATYQTNMQRQKREEVHLRETLKKNADKELRACLDRALPTDITDGLYNNTHSSSGDSGSTSTQSSSD